MPRGSEYHSLRARGLCVDCGTVSDVARCPACKAKENARRRAARKLRVVSIESVRDEIDIAAIRRGEPMGPTIIRMLSHPSYSSNILA